MSYKDRLRKEIKLTSPGGTEFVASWRGNPITLTNNVDIKKAPGVQGARVKDLRPDAFLYPLTIFFSGPDNDKDSTEFMNALRDEPGVWRIDHPVKGPIFLTHLGSTEHVEPITSGGVTRVETSWIEGLPENAEIAAAQLQAQAEAQAALANATSSDEFANTAKQETAGQRQSIISAVGQVITKTKQFLSNIENASIIDPQIIAIGTAINNTLSQPVIDTTQLAGQLQQTIQLYGLGQTSSTDGVTMYSDFADSVVEIAPEQPNDDGISTIAVTELSATAALTAAGQMSLIGGATSRQEAIGTVDKINTMFETITNALDNIQTLYGDNFIDKAYFSQTESYGDSLLMNSFAVSFLLASLFGLPSERRFILKKRTATPQIAHDEYGNIGTPDGETGNLDYVDILIATNNLCGVDMYYLDAGREVLIYQN